MDQKLQRGTAASRPLVFRQAADANIPGRHPHCEGKNDRCLTTISSEPATSKKAPSVRSSTSYYRSACLAGQRGLHPETRFRPAGRQAPAGLRCAPARRSFFKSLLCLKVALRVHGTPRHAAEIQLLQQLADAALMQMNMEFGGDAVPQVSTAPAHHAIGLEVRTALHPLGHLTPLGLGEARLTQCLFCCHFDVATFCKW